MEAVTYSEKPHSKQDCVLSMFRYLNLIQDAKRDPVPADPVPHSSREHPEDIRESESSGDNDVQNSSEDEDSEPKWPEDEKSNQTPDETNSDVRTTNYLLTLTLKFLKSNFSKGFSGDWATQLFNVLCTNTSNSTRMKRLT